MATLQDCCTTYVNTGSGNDSQKVALIAACLTAQGVGFPGVTDCVKGTGTTTSSGNSLVTNAQLVLCNTTCLPAYLTGGATAYDACVAQCVANILQGGNIGSGTVIGTAQTTGTATQAAGTAINSVLSGNPTDATGCAGCGVSNMGACVQCVASSLTHGLTVIGVNVLLGILVLFGLWMFFSEESLGSTVKRGVKTAVKVTAL